MPVPEPRPARPRTVLVTRPEPAAGETARRLAAMGFVPILTPALAVRRRAARLPAPGELQAILVTSANAIPALPASHHGVMLLAVGEATAAAARGAGFRAVHAAAGDAAALAALALARCAAPGPAVLLAAGAGQGGDLAARLRAGGLRVHRRVLYAAVARTALPRPARAALAAGHVDAALFFSAASARAFAAQLEACLPAAAVAGIEALAISAATAAALAPLPWRAIRVASRPNQSELLALLS